MVNTQSVFEAQSEHSVSTLSLKQHGGVNLTRLSTKSPQQV